MASNTLRVLLATHHFLDPDTQSVTLALGNALQVLGCLVEHVSYDDMFPGTEESTWHQVRFPWLLAVHLVRRAAAYDVLDITTGDNWLWASTGRPGAAPRHALVTRSHGLEHTYSERLREDAREGLNHLSWKYPLYHGGFRLWEVRRSLQLADHVVLLNARDAAYARDRLDVPAEHLSIISNGVDAAFHNVPLVEQGSERPRLGLAFVGTWMRPKGTAELVAAATRLHSDGLPFTLTLLGTGTESGVREEFPPDVREHIRVVPRFHNTDLPTLLADQEVLLFPTHSEGFSLALIEGMACGLVPVTTPVGGAVELVRPDETGVLTPVGNVSAIVDAVRALARDPSRRLALRRAAQVAVRALSWPNIAARTLALYEDLLRRRSRP